MCHELRESSYGLKIESFKDNMIIFSKLISEWCKNFLFTQQVCWISSMHNIKHLCNIFVKVARVLRPVVHMRFQVCKISNMCAIILIWFDRVLKWVATLLQWVVQKQFQVCKTLNVCAILLVELLGYFSKLYLYFNELFICGFKCAKYQTCVQFYWLAC